MSWSLGTSGITEIGGYPGNYRYFATCLFWRAIEGNSVDIVLIAISHGPSNTAPESRRSFITRVSRKRSGVWNIRIHYTQSDVRLVGFNAPLRDEEMLAGRGVVGAQTTFSARLISSALASPAINTQGTLYPA
jgi:hypothetical protein